jgi:D-hexose-6-phosphate mutarotase
MPGGRSLDELNERFGIPHLVRFEAGSGGLACAQVTAPAAEATIYLHGAHVTHHRAAGARRTLFLSARSRFASGAAIRGGVPLVFPWFGPRAGHPSAPEHGFARINEWTVDSAARDGDGAVIAFALEPTDAIRALWPSEVRLVYRVRVHAALELALDVENRSKARFSFEAAMHTYLEVGDVREASLAGLEGATYIDKTDAMKRKTLEAAPFRPAAETDRVFPGSRGTCTVIDPVLARRIAVEKSGSATTVVWNPWSEKAGRMADLGADQWTSMLCVETANAMDDVIQLKPGATHAMTATIRTSSR